MSAREPFDCPVCGEEVPAGSKSCPECGSCERSGWRADTVTEGLDLTDGDDFDYEKFVGEEFGTGSKRPGLPLIWWVAGVLALLAFLALLLRS